MTNSNILIYQSEDGQTKNIFLDEELTENQVVRNFRTTASDGKNYNTNFYNLDVIISVGYRVKSLQDTKFRQWAIQGLKEYIIADEKYPKCREENKNELP